MLWVPNLSQLITTKATVLCDLFSIPLSLDCFIDTLATHSAARIESRLHAQTQTDGTVIGPNTSDTTLTSVTVS